MLDQQAAPQGKILKQGGRCLSCRRRFEKNERRSSYKGVEVCGGCKALQEVGDLAERFTTLNSTVSGLSARERI